MLILYFSLLANLTFCIFIEGSEGIRMIPPMCRQISGVSFLLLLSMWILGNQTQVVKFSAFPELACELPPSIYGNMIV